MSPQQEEEQHSNPSHDHAAKAAGKKSKNSNFSKRKFKQKLIPGPMFKPLPTYPTLPVPEINILYKLEQLKSHRHTQDY